MKILHLSAASEQTGAGKATLLTHNALLQLGIQSRVLFLKSDIEAEEVYSYHKTNRTASFNRLLKTSLDRLPVMCYTKRTNSIFSPGIFGLKFRNNNFINWADVVHIHWANQGFINIKEIQKWNKPVVWTLRDMWAFTGGCHQAFECENFKISCGNCPALGSTHITDLSKHVLKRKFKYIQPINISWVAISSWMQSMANKSALLKDKLVEVVHSGVDSSIFDIYDKEQIRLKIGLANDKPIIILGAGNIREKYKGFDYAVEVLRKMRTDVLVITFGAGSFKQVEIPQEVIHFGEVEPHQLKELYNAADVFLGPSIAEAMGKTFLEAQLCGLPVVCFDKTGPVDIVKHEETGYIAKHKDVTDLVNGLELCLNSKMDRCLIRSRAVELFDINKVAKAYIGIYEKSIVDWTNSTHK